MNKVKEIKSGHSSEIVVNLLFDGDAQVNRALRKSLLKHDHTQLVEKKSLTFQKKTALREKFHVNEIFGREAQQVLKLKDEIISASHKSKFGEKFMENRQRNYEEIFKQFLSELEYLGEDMKETLEFVSQHLLQNLNDNNNDIEQKLATLKLGELFQIEIDYKNLWKFVDTKYDENSIWIEEFCATLSKQENLKMIKIQELFKSVYGKLVAVGYLNPEKIRNHLFNFAVEFQRKSLKNLEEFSNLQWNLTVHDEINKLEHFFRWNQFWKSWLNDLVSSAKDQFLIAMSALASGDYGFVKDIIRKFNHDCDMLKNKRLFVLFDIRSIKPPNCNREVIEKWSKNLSSLKKEHDDICETFGEHITMNHPQLVEQLTSDLTMIKKSLLERGICSEAVLNANINENMIELMNDYLLDLNLTVENTKRFREYERDGLDALEEDIHKTVTDVVELWKTNQLAFSNLMTSTDKAMERIMQQMTDMCDHEEKKLTVVLDRMREETNLAGLESCLKEALEFLEVIKSIYLTHHNERVDTIKSLPALISTEVNNYRYDLKDFFGPTAGHLFNPIFGNAKKDEVESLSPSESIKESDSEKRMDKADRQSLQSEMKDRPGRKSTVPKKSWETINLSQYVIPWRPTEAYSTFMIKELSTQVAPLQSLSAKELKKIPSDIAWIGCETLLQHLLRILCVNFAAHWEQWLLQTIKQADSLKEIKLIELKNELALQIKLHESRIERIKCDIFDLRLKELISHSDKVTRHVMKIKKEINALNLKIEKFKHEQNENITQLREKVQEMKKCMANVSTTNGVIDFRNKLELTIADEIKKQNNVIDAFREEIEAGFKSFHESNDNMSRSFKSFFNNGNYSDDEIIKLNNQLHNLNPSLHSVENASGKALHDLKAALTEEKEHLIKKLKTDLDGADVDMTFVEAVNRCFTDVQVKIKCEVKMNNTLSYQVQKNIETITSVIDEESFDTVNVNDLIERYFTVVKNYSKRAIMLGVIPFNDVEHSPSSVSTALPTGMKVRRPSSVLNQIRIPAEFSLFESELTESGRDFLLLIRQILVYVQQDLFRLSEHFYQKKHNREVRFPHLIPPNHDQCCRELTAKIKDYWNQTKYYHQQSVEELFDQIDQVNFITTKFIPFIYNALMAKYEKFLNDPICTQEVKINKILKEWSSKSISLKNKLRPQLGFPSYNSELQKFLDEAKNEKDEYLEKITQIYIDLKDSTKKNAIEFLIEINKTTEILMKGFEKLLTDSDLLFAKTKFDIPKLHEEGRKPSIRLTNVRSLEIWPQMKNEISFEKITKKIVTAKSNFAQQQLIQSRDLIYEKFGGELRKILSYLREENEKRSISVNSKYENILIDVNNLKETVQMM